MLSRLCQRVLRNAAMKRSIRGLSSDAEVSSGSSQLDSWLKIYSGMQNEAAKHAEGAVSGVRSELVSFKTGVSAELAGVKSDLVSFKTEVRSDISELRKGQAEIHKQITNNTRLLLAAMLGIASFTVGANHFLERKEKQTHMTSSQTLLTSAPSLTMRH